MIKSMTGYGKAECECRNRKIVVEIKSLNSKQLDINTRIANGFREKEIELRNYLSGKLQRGKIDFTISIENQGDSTNFIINKELAKKYYRELKSLSSEFEEKNFSDYLPIIMKFPDVLVPEKEEISDEEWKSLLVAIDEAVIKVEQFRLVEGQSLANELTSRNKTILKLLDAVLPFEKERMENIKAKISKDLYELANKDNIDKNRFEQELVYYQDKIDITEEKVRLKKHCDYFSETMAEPESQGKKLIFITQEMGREINTLGSKAGEANIQKIVVEMKDELEKIKEQLFNIL